MPVDLSSAVIRLLDTLVARSSNDPVLRSQLRRAAIALLDALETAESGSQSLASLSAAQPEVSSAESISPSPGTTATAAADSLNPGQPDSATDSLNSAVLSALADTLSLAATGTAHGSGDDTAAPSNASGTASRASDPVANPLPPEAIDWPVSDDEAGTAGRDQSADHGPLPPLLLGTSLRPPLPRSPSPVRLRTDEPDIDWGLIRTRCQLKAKASEWASERQATLAMGGTLTAAQMDRYGDLIAEAKALRECFLWMCAPRSESRAASDGYTLLARAYEVLAAAILLVENPANTAELPAPRFQRSLELLAEAQSALRSAAVGVGYEHDLDQEQVFQWLKKTTLERHIYVEHYMRIGEPADPTRHADLMVRVEHHAAHLSTDASRQRQTKKLLSKLQFQVEQLQAADPEAAPAHWERIVLTVDELLALGVAPNQGELRDILLEPCAGLESLDDLAQRSESFDRVYHELLPWIEEREQQQDESGAALSAEVAEAAELLAGKTIVLIGGDRRPDAEEALRDALGLAEVLWISTRSHQSIDHFEPYVARPEVAVVLLAIRWASHSFGDVRQFCERFGKPLVRLPQGYNPSQVAHQIVQQCSARLRSV